VLQRRGFYTLLCLLEVLRVPKGRGLSVRWRWSSQAVSVGLHCAGRAVLACFELGRRGGRCHAGDEGSALHLCMARSRKGDWSCGRAVSVLARQRSGWSRDLVEPRLLSTRVSSVEGQALRRRKEMLTLDVLVQPIDKRFASARPPNTGV
jgi:hypothetical protein